MSVNKSASYAEASQCAVCDEVSESSEIKFDDTAFERIEPKLPPKVSLITAQISQVSRGPAPRNDGSFRSPADRLPREIRGWNQIDHNGTLRGMRYESGSDQDHKNPNGNGEAAQYTTVDAHKHGLDVGFYKYHESW